MTVERLCSICHKPIKDQTRKHKNNCQGHICPICGRKMSRLKYPKKGTWCEGHDETEL